MPNDRGCCRSLFSYDLVRLLAASSAAATAAATGVAVAYRVDAESRRRHHRDRNGREICLHGYHLRSIWIGS